jgi:[ribosomal protein S18]-alanine N-acetyltransferase
MIAPNPPDEAGADGVSIRPLTQKDLESVVRIERLSYSVPWSNATFRGLLFRADTDLLCAELDGAVVGYAVCWFVLDQGELGNVAVDPGFRRRGIAALLVEATLERARKRRAKEIFLEVRRSNDVAQRLYKRLGFREVGVRRNYYSLPAEDALVMRAAIDRFS